jgi:hypothetical protein
VGGLFGALVGSNTFDPRPFMDDNASFSAGVHPTTAGYIGETAMATAPVLVICLLMIPLLRRAGSPAPRIAAFGFALIPIGAFTLITIDGAIRDRQPHGCCQGPGLPEVWWYLWIAAAILITISSIASSAMTLARPPEERVGSVPGGQG